MFKKTNFSRVRFHHIFLIVGVLIVLTTIFYYKQSIVRVIYPLEQAQDLEPLIKKASKAYFVLLGESSHGTAEYYEWRALISKELITKENFSLIVVEGDWDALYQVNSYVKHKTSPSGGAREILNSFDRWPTWMWANEEFLDFVEWLRTYNSYQLPEKMVGIYGKDIYGGRNSISLVIEYLSSQSAESELLARQAYSCLAEHDYDWQKYLEHLSLGLSSCEKEFMSVVKLLDSFNIHMSNQEYFNALQNAWVVVHAEEHYRANLFNPNQAWNSRVLGMKNIFNRLKIKYGVSAKSIIWAHNTHVGDARATEMVNSGLVNIGQLLRERHGDESVFIVGFGTYQGSVIAGLNWGDSASVLTIPPARKGSLEDFLASKKDSNFFIFLDNSWQETVLAENLGHRAKGVVYNPVNDIRNYVGTIAINRYDAFIFLHKTRALTPLK